MVACCSLLIIRFSSVISLKEDLMQKEEIEQISSNRLLCSGQSDTSLSRLELQDRNLIENMWNGYAECRMVVEEGHPVDFIYEKVNSRFEILTGLKHVEGRRVSEVIPGIHEINPELLEIYGRVAATAETERFECYISPLKIWFDISAFSIKTGHFIAVFENITEHKQIGTERNAVEEALKQSENRFKKLFEGHTAIKLVIDPETGSIIDANPAAAAFYGWPVEQLRQMLIQEINTLPPENVMEEMEKACTALNNHFVFRHRRANNSLCDVEVFSNKIEIAGRVLLYSIIHDVSDRKQDEHYLEQLNGAIQQQSPAVIVVTDQAGDIEYVNPMFTQITGYSAEEVRGKNHSILQSGLMAKEVYDDLWHTIRSGKIWRGELQNRKKTGELYWDLTVISAMLNSDGAITNFIAVKVDITKQKTMLSDLIKAKDDALKSDQMKTRFLANISHEIRTPMNGILGFAQLLKEPHLSEKEQAEYIDLIEQSGERMLNLINNLINISRIEAGETLLHMAETPVNELLRDLYAFFKPEIDKKGLRLHCITALSDSESVIETDSGKLVQILTNLIQNALKFTRKGGIDFGYNCLNGLLEFYVIDTGIGIALDMKEKIFDRFHQVDNPVTRTEEGAGLGLSISKAFVEMLGSAIRVESGEEWGSKFYFTLPYRHNSSTITPLPPPVMQPPAITVPTLTILIAEDDAVSRLLLEMYFQKENITTLLACNGKDAVIFVDHNPEINLVLMDLKMPIMNGYEATRVIKKIRPDLPIIAQTAFTSKEERQKAIEAGCDGFISKPIDRNNLLKLITEMLIR